MANSNAERQRQRRWRKQNGEVMATTVLTPTVIDWLMMEGWIGPRTRGAELNDAISDLLQCLAEGRLEHHLAMSRVTHSHFPNCADSSTSRFLLANLDEAKDDGTGS